ncbi:hypothetical protein YQE_10157, partial [Dendroctonus ponderosae]
MLICGCSRPWIKMKIIVYLVSLGFAVTSTESKKVASYISPCKKADPNFCECAVKQANDAVPHLIDVDLQFFDKYFYELYKKPDGKQYPKRTGLEINVTARDAKFHLDNLFNGNKQLGDNMNKLLNENPQEVLRDLGFPIAKEVAGLMVGSVVDAIVTDVPFDELFLP